MMLKPKLDFLNRFFRSYRVLAFLYGGISMFIILLVSKEECRQYSNPKEITIPPLTKTYAVYQQQCRAEELTNLYDVLEKMGYRNNQTPGDDWDFVWVADDPYDEIQEDLEKMERHQKLNRIPGSGNFTDKVELATTELPFIPTAFRLPQQKAKLLEYSEAHSFTTFIQKGTGFRKIGTISSLNLNLPDSCVQVFIEKPLLIAGRKFEIGIYVIVTSIDPLRVYIYNGDADVRFAPKTYYPIGPYHEQISNRFVPIWEVPEMQYYFFHLGLGIRDTLNIFMRSQGKDPSSIWTQIEESVKILLLAKEPFMAAALKKYKRKCNFFEMVRFDFIVDDELKVYLLTIEKRPNLSSPRYPREQLLQKQLLYNVFGLVEMAETNYKNTLEVSYKNDEEEMIVADKQLATYPEICKDLCKNDCTHPDCQLCKPCLSPKTRQNLEEAFKENLNRGDCKRLFPPIDSKEDASKPVSDDYSAENQLHYRWFKGKCLLDRTWCNS